MNFAALFTICFFVSQATAQLSTSPSDCPGGKPDYDKFKKEYYEHYLHQTDERYKQELYNIATIPGQLESLADQACANFAFGQGSTNTKRGLKHGQEVVQKFKNTLQSFNEKFQQSKKEISKAPASDPAPAPAHGKRQVAMATDPSDCPGGKPNYDKFKKEYYEHYLHQTDETYKQPLYDIAAQPGQLEAMADELCKNSPFGKQQ